eukprot:284814590_5
MLTSDFTSILLAHRHKKRTPKALLHILSSFIKCQRRSGFFDPLLHVFNSAGRSHHSICKTSGF